MPDIDEIARNKADEIRRQKEETAQKAAQKVVDVKDARIKTIEQLIPQAMQLLAEKAYPNMVPVNVYEYHKGFLFFPDSEETHIKAGWIVGSYYAGSSNYYGDSHPIIILVSDGKLAAGGYGRNGILEASIVGLRTPRSSLDFYEERFLTTCINGLEKICRELNSKL